MRVYGREPIAPRDSGKCVLCPMQPGQIIQNYRLLSLIGEGGMGTVWLAEQLNVDRKVAIKVLHPQYARNAPLRARFRAEAETLARLRHPNIVTFHDLIETDEQLCLVMEHVQGRNLEDLVRRETGPLPADKLSTVFRQILLAFDHAHRAGVVHRDIKPSNFMLTDDGTVKVLDFGIAKLLHAEHGLTQTGTRMGTTLYMAPEQVTGGAVDTRTDVYALGVTLFFLATGRNPYDGETVEYNVYERILKEPLPVASSLYPGVSQGVDRLIAKATMKDPRQRFQSCGDFLVGQGIGHVVPGAQPPPQPLDKGGRLPLKDFPRLQWLSFLSIPGGFFCCWVPLMGRQTDIGSLGLLASLGIVVSAIATLARAQWARWSYTVCLLIYAVACLMAILQPGSLGSSSYRNTQTINGMTTVSEGMSNGSEYVVAIATLALLYALIALYQVHARRHAPYWEALGR